MYYFLPLSLLFKAKESYALRAVNKDILKAKLTNVLQTMPSGQEKGLVRGLWHSSFLMELKSCSVK